MVRHSKIKLTELGSFITYLYFSLTPFESVNIYENFSLVKLLIALLLPTHILVICLTKVRVIMPLWVMVISSLYTLFTTFWSITPEKSFYSGLLTILPSVVLMIVIFTSLNNARAIVNCLRAYVLGITVFSLISIYSISNDGYAALVSSRFTILGQDQNELSMLLCFGLASQLAISNYWKENVFFSRELLDKFFNLSLFIIVLFLIFVSGSRTGVIVFMFIFLMNSLLSSSKIDKFYHFIIGTLLITLLISFSIYSDSRILEIYSEVKDGDFTGRGYIWREVTNYWLSNGNFLLGSGFQSFENVSFLAFNEYFAGHNTYLIYLIETGLFGGVLYILSITLCFIYAYKSDKRLFWYSLIVLSPFLIGSFTLGLETRRWMYIFMALVLAQSYVNIRSLRV